MKIRIIGIGIVAVALILAISMTASADPDPVGADVTVETNSVRLGYFNGTGTGDGSYTDDVELSTQQAQSAIYYKLDALTGTGLYNITITYINTSGGSTTMHHVDAVAALDTWETVTVIDLVDITNIVSTEYGSVTAYDITVYANLTKQTAAQGTAESDAAEGGYITEMDMTGNSQTVKWQGYYGDITGNIRLADASGDYMYTWDWDPSTGGAVFAVARSTMPNFGVVDTCDITELEANAALISDSIWSATGADSVTITFGADNDNSVEFYVAGNTVEASNRNAMYTLMKTGNAASAFEEVLLTDRATVDTVDDMIWTCLIENGAEDYTGGESDYQMIVPATDIGGGTTTYYFYVEML